MAIAFVLAAAVAAAGGRVPIDEVTLSEGSTAGELAAAGGGPIDPGGAAADAGTAGSAATGGPGATTAPGQAGAAGPGERRDPGVTDTEIRIGGSTFTSGPAAVYGEQIAVGFTAGVQYVNDHGGVNGRRLALTLYDDGGDPAKQLANTKRLLEVDKVFALSMVYAASVGDYVASQGVPVVHLGQF
ncbi:MAG TPA: ABC transporter substrate-binding protein, partial [Acidimicrobiales bacterium]|nr:ABC transporter substrate-binding protein [Acidimicrobiales bacterium]